MRLRNKAIRASLRYLLDNFDKIKEGENFYEQLEIEDKRVKIGVEFDKRKEVTIRLVNKTDDEN